MWLVAVAVLAGVATRAAAPASSALPGAPETGSRLAVQAVEAVTHGGGDGSSNVLQGISHANAGHAKAIVPSSELIVGPATSLLTGPRDGSAGSARRAGDPRAETVSWNECRGPPLAACLATAFPASPSV